MAFDSLQDRLTKSLKNIAGKGKLSERNMEDTLQKIVGDLQNILKEFAQGNYTVRSSCKEAYVGEFETVM